MTDKESKKQNDSRYSVKSPGRGGPRPGAGRPKGSGNKIKIEDLIDSIEQRAGVPFTEQIATNYVGAILREDWARVENYDKALLNKIVADKNEITVEEVGDVIDAKKEAFKEAILALNINNKEDDSNATD